MLDQPTSYSQAELGVPEARREEPRGMDWGYFHHEQNATPLYSMSYVIISTPTSDRLTSSGAALALVFGNLPLGREARTGRNGSAAAGYVRCSPAQRCCNAPTGARTTPAPARARGSGRTSFETVVL